MAIITDSHGLGLDDDTGLILKYPEPLEDRVAKIASTSEAISNRLSSVQRPIQHTLQAIFAMWDKKVIPARIATRMQSLGIEPLSGMEEVIKASTEAAAQMSSISGITGISGDEAHKLLTQEIAHIESGLDANTQERIAAECLKIILQERHDINTRLNVIVGDMILACHIHKPKSLYEFADMMAVHRKSHEDKMELQLRNIFAEQPAEYPSGLDNAILKRQAEIMTIYECISKCFGIKSQVVGVYNRLCDKESAAEVGKPALQSNSLLRLHIEAMLHPQVGSSDSLAIKDDRISNGVIADAINELRVCLRKPVLDFVNTPREALAQNLYKTVSEAMKVKEGGQPTRRGIRDIRRLLGWVNLQNIGENRHVHGENNHVKIILKQLKERYLEIAQNSGLSLHTAEVLMEMHYISVHEIPSETPGGRKSVFIDLSPEALADFETEKNKISSLTDHSKNHVDLRGLLKRWNISHDNSRIPVVREMLARLREDEIMRRMFEGEGSHDELSGKVDADYMRIGKSPTLRGIYKIHPQAMAKVDAEMKLLFPERELQALNKSVGGIT